MKRYLLFESSELSLKYLSEGQKIKVSAGGKVICVARYRGNIYAFDNACPHKGHPLHEGHLNHLDEIVCVSHAYRFRLDTGEECENRCGDLKHYKVEEDNDQYFIEC